MADKIVSTDNIPLVVYVDGKRTVVGEASVDEAGVITSKFWDTQPPAEKIRRPQTLSFSLWRPKFVTNLMRGEAAGRFPDDAKPA